jgi:hypothetical protein
MELEVLELSMDAIGDGVHISEQIFHIVKVSFETGCRFLRSGRIQIAAELQQRHIRKHAMSVGRSPESRARNDLMGHDGSVKKQKCTASLH